MSILQWIDVGIGYAFAMLLLATLTGAFVGLVQSIWRTRARQLEDGIVSILANLAPGEALSGKADVADSVLPASKTSLVHPKVVQLARSIINDVSVKGSWLAADIIQREEFVLLILRKAAADPAGKDGFLWKLVVELTGKPPAELLTDIETLLVEIEQADPKAPAYLWKVRAIYRAGAAALAGRIFAWYDNTMRRVEDRVNFSARWWSLAFSLVLCIWMNVNSVELITRLQKDSVFRLALSQAGEKAANAPAPAQQTTSTREEFAAQMAQTQSLLGLKDQLSWDMGYQRLAAAFGDRMTSFGIWLSAVMVSLGTAFWYGLLKKLIGLKSSMKEAAEAMQGEREGDQRAKGQT